MVGPRVIDNVRPHDHGERRGRIVQYVENVAGTTRPYHDRVVMRVLPPLVRTIFDKAGQVPLADLA